MVDADFSGSNVWDDWAVTPLKLMTVDELDQRPDPEWLVGGVLQLDTLALMYGPPSSTKTFIGIDLACSVALGRPWLGHQTPGGDVVYLFAEGSGGMKQRVRSWRQAHGEPRLDRLHFIEGPVNLLDEEAVTSLVDLLTSESLIVLDTLARCMPGDENSSKDMGKAVAALDRLRSASGATVLAIHHSRKSGDAERGSSALTGAVATQLAVSRRNGIEIRCEKQKDDEAFEPIRVHLEPVGDSCVIRRGNNVATLNESQVSYLRLLPERFGNTPVGRQEWNEASGLADRTADRRRGVLADLGLVRRTGPGKNDPWIITDAGRAALVANVAK